jgi:hypothetical protein
MVGVPGYRTEMYCVSCEVRTEFIYVEESRQLSKGNFNAKEKWVTGPRWATDTRTDWPTDYRS